MMFNIERQNEILSVLEKSGSISVNELSRLLYVSPPTVRRDLDSLEHQGRVIRTHGGVVLRETAEREIPLIWREEQNNISKRKIAEKAVKYIKNGDVIFLDASSTVSYLIDLFRDFEDLIVITNSPKSSMRLGAANIKNYCTGGLLLNHSVAYVGSEAEKFVGNFNADVFFFSSRGYTENGNITDSSAEEASIKKAMMKNTERSFYLCDSSKLDKKYMYNICHTSDVEQIITECDI